MKKRKRAMAPYGEKMIKLTVRFWTNDISTKPRHIVKKECWDSGVVSLPKNSAHGIAATQPVPFHSLLELSAKIEKLFIAHNVKLHPGQRSRKYLATKP